MTISAWKSGSARGFPFATKIAAHICNSLCDVAGIQAPPVVTTVTPEVQK